MKSGGSRKQYSERSVKLAGVNPVWAIRRWDLRVRSLGDIAYELRLIFPVTE